MSKINLRKQYLKLAYDQLNPKGNDIQALEQVLTNWFCLKLETTPNDPRLLNMRLDELLLFRMMHEINDRPSIIEEIGPGADEYEEWLKSQMGADYKSSDDMVSDHEKIEEEERKLSEDLPKEIRTNFSQAKGE